MQNIYDFHMQSRIMVWTECCDLVSNNQFVMDHHLMMTIANCFADNIKPEINSSTRDIILKTTNIHTLIHTNLQTFNIRKTIQEKH